MSVERNGGRIDLPESLRDRLREFRGRLWAVKSAEAAGTATFGVMASYLILFGLDRVGETPGWARLTLFAAAALACALVPLALHRWIWRRRRPDQLARLIARRMPSLGDQLLGAIELVRNEAELARSPALCEAAVRQVADDVSRRDLNAAVPRPRHRRWAAIAAVPTAAAAMAFGLWPDAAANAWARLAAPWRDVPRYTFAAVAPLPDRIIVPHGEPSTVVVRLGDGGRWRPGRGEATVGSLPPISAARDGGRYAFELPPLLDARPIVVRVGDAVLRSRVEPTLRPELAAIAADVTLPNYLERPGSSRIDARGGTLSAVNGSRARLSATAGRALASARVDGRPARVDGATIAGPELLIDGPGSVVFAWTDQLGLGGKAPFTLAIDGRDDEAPSVSCEGLPQRRVVLETEQLAFAARARDDFGVKRVGLEWQWADPSASQAPDRGEQILAAGGSDRELLDVDGVFMAKALGIRPQPIVVRIFAEDYLPGRPRSYSPPYMLYVLSPEQHAIWLTEQLSRWQRRSLEVRDREMQLLETNKELRSLPPEELDEPGTRRRIEEQAEAERANGRKLSGLAADGEELVRQAMRNPEFGVGHLESLAEILQVLKDIAANRMPSVADLLDEAAEAPTTGTPRQPRPQAPRAGEQRASGAGGASGEPEGGEPRPIVPQVVDGESSQQPPGEPSDAAPPAPGAGSVPRLGLPGTTLMGQAGGPPAACPTGEKLDEAVRRQEDLLAEFEKVAAELNRVLGNLEGSTLVKRLKAAARLQYEIAGRIVDRLDDAFGRAERALDGAVAASLDEEAERERASSVDVSTIMDDMQSYFERRRLVRLKEVLDDMREQDVVGNLRQLGDAVKGNAGLAVAQCEYWSDSLDRWAEDLVDPASGGT